MAGGKKGKGKGIDFIVKYFMDSFYQKNNIEMFSNIFLSVTLLRGMRG